MVYNSKSGSYKTVLSFIVALSLVFCWAIANAQIVPDMQAVIHGVDASDPKSPRAFVSIIKGQRISPNEEPIMALSPVSLAAEAFEVRLDGSKIEDFQVEVFNSSPEGIDLVLAIDISGSVYRDFSLVKKAIGKYIDNLRVGKDRISILTFGVDVQVAEFPVADQEAPDIFTDNVELLKEALGRKPPRSRMQSTVLFKALFKAIQIAGQGRLSQERRAIEKAVIVLTDGHDEGTGFTIDDCIEEAKKHRVPILALGIPEEKTGNKYHGNLEKIAISTNGVFVPVNDMEKLENVYNKLDELIKNQYVVTFQPPSELASGESYDLRIAALHEGDIVEAETSFLPMLARREGGSEESALGEAPIPVGITVEQLAEIERLRDELGWSDDDLDRFIEDDLLSKREELDSEQATTLMSKLSDELKNNGNGTGNEKSRSWWNPWWAKLIIIAVGMVLVAIVALLIHAGVRSRQRREWDKDEEDSATTSQQDNAA